MAWHPKLRSDLRCEVLSWVNEEVQACLSNITPTTKKNVNDLADFAFDTRSVKSIMSAQKTLERRTAV